jgi:hypothetical protein
MGGIYDAYGVRKAMEVRQDAWGHLAPEFNRKYPGYIVIATSPYSGLGWTVVEDSFPGADGNPWYYDGLVDYINGLDLEEGKLYLWKGTFEFVRDRRGRYLDEHHCRFRGRARRIKLPIPAGARRTGDTKS